MDKGPLLFACDDKKLFSEKFPRHRQAQVHANKEQRMTASVIHAIRHEFADTFFDFEGAVGQCFAQGVFGQGQVVIPKIPIGAIEVLDVWAHGDEVTAGSEAAIGFIEGPA